MLQNSKGLIVALCSPEDGHKEDSEEFYEIPQKVANNINRNNYIKIVVDFNASVGLSLIHI